MQMKLGPVLKRLRYVDTGNLFNILKYIYVNLLNKTLYYFLRKRQQIQQFWMHRLPSLIHLLLFLIHLQQSLMLLPSLIYLLPSLICLLLFLIHLVLFIIHLQWRSVLGINTLKLYSCLLIIQDEMEVDEGAVDSAAPDAVGGAVDSAAPDAVEGAVDSAAPDAEEVSQY